MKFETLKAFAIRSVLAGAVALAAYVGANYTDVVDPQFAGIAGAGIMYVIHAIDAWNKKYGAPTE